ncbi:MAG TPA: serine hydrolase [Candidatus Binatia bacterium]|nr:serine hydrolase [Candidatus Binatia bacterium]
MSIRTSTFVTAALMVSLLVPAGARPDERTAQATTAARQAAVATPAGLERLERQIARAIGRIRGTVGVAVEHLESGARVAINDTQRFPMASVYKLPILVELWAQARAGRLRWSDRVELAPADRHIGSGDISVYFDLPGVAMDLRNLANMMMIISDNSATDLLLGRVGAASVTARMRALGLNDIRVDRTTQELILDYGGHDTAKLKGLLLEELRPLLRRGPEDEADRLARDARLAADPRDQATPRDLTRLLAMLWRGEVVDREASTAMLELMKRCQTGAGRLKGLLPPGTTVAHKTGTLGGTINDAGVIYLPDDAGHVAITVLTREMRGPAEEVERLIADIARSVYDYFYFTTRPEDTRP